MIILSYTEFYRCVKNCCFRMSQKYTKSYAPAVPMYIYIFI